MKATVNGITYEGTEDEIRRIVENPPARPPVRTTCGGNTFPRENQPPYHHDDALESEFALLH